MYSNKKHVILELGFAFLAQYTEEIVILIVFKPYIYLNKNIF